MKLKTLKDMAEPLEFIKDKGTLKIIKYYELKEEAVKWIKANPDDIFFGSEKISNWIKHFFNIKEDDLK